MKSPTVLNTSVFHSSLDRVKDHDKAVKDKSRPNMPVDNSLGQSLPGGRRGYPDKPGHINNSASSNKG